MQFSELIKHRQSDRKYADRPVEREKLLQCLEAARLSPSADNAQPWKLVVVDDPALKEQVASCATELGMNRFVHQAPVIVAVVLERMNVMATIASAIKRKDFSLLDVGMAVNQLCLQAADIGLGTCIIGWFDEKRVKQLLQVDRGRRVPLLVTIGYSEAQTRDKVRKSIEQMSSWNRY
ncbi:nitroreductase family protein [uncultured Acetobacteroides sp.]|uniref:nitroreductase family protein n=1 Tax=uncultured Acetobacteroides sp. TaxID=1760811 RepID=UPI0029F4FDA1|nr:nitroreductase family protein [uncultured Acetobacteroides sp.]